MIVERVRNQGLFPKCRVQEVSPPPEGEELEAFKATYLSDVYLHEGDTGFEDRLARCIDLQFARWEWANANLETYVNMLRVSGHSDQKIELMATAGIPMSFKSVSQYGGFKFALLQLRDEFEHKEKKLTNVAFAHTGSSVPGYSSNPLKGLPELPSKVTAVGKSDVDLVFIGDGVSAAVERMRTAGKTIRTYPTTMDNRSEEMRYGVEQEDIQLISPLFFDFIKLWEEKLGASIQVTFQETPKAAINPWETLVTLIDGP